MFTRLSLTVGAASLCFASISQAALFATPIDNASFEDQVTASFESKISSWTEESNAAGETPFVQNETSAANMPDTSTGPNWGGLTGSSAIFQEIGTFTENEILRLSGEVGDRSNKVWAGLSLEIWAGGTTLVGPGADSADGSTLASRGAVLVTSYSVPFTETGAIQTAAFSNDFNTGATTLDYTNGDALWLRIAGESGTNAPQSFIDGLSLTVVPEPSSLALLGLGGMLIARRRRG